jgi:hypothetical protein
VSARASADAEDAQRVRPRFEDKIKRAMDRVARGTYLPGPMFADRDEAGRWAAPETACGAHRDDFGRCAARYHDAACLEVARGSAATSDATAVEAWNRVLRSGSEASAALLSNAHRTGQDWDEALAGPGPGSADVLAYMREQLGIGGRADLPQPARPAAGSMAGILGLD